MNDPMQLVPMNQNEAREQLSSGGFLIILNAPVGLHLGIDCTTYQTGPHFKGIKMIPPGIHFFHFGLGETDRQGIFFQISSGQIHIYCWDDDVEDIVHGDKKLPNNSLIALQNSVTSGQLDSFLGPYPISVASTWLNLSNSITPNVLKRCGILLGLKISAGSEPENTKTDQNAEKTCIIPYFVDIATSAKFSTLSSPTQNVIPTNENASYITRHYLDRSNQIEELIHRQLGDSWKELLGEIQLSFVLFMYISSLGGFRHWQELVAALCRCETLIESNSSFYKSYIRVLHAQLKLVPQDFFACDLSKGNFLESSLSALFQNVSGNSGIERDVTSACRQLLQFIQMHFKLFMSAQIDPEHSYVSAFELVDDDQPVIVPYEDVQKVLGPDLNLELTDIVEGATENMDTHTVIPMLEEVDVFQPTKNINERWKSISMLLNNVDATRISMPEQRSDIRTSAYSNELVQKYPKLFAEINPALGEDVVMTAARVISGVNSDNNEKFFLDKETYTEAVAFLEKEAACVTGDFWYQLHS